MSSYMAFAEFQEICTNPIYEDYTKSTEEKRCPAKFFSIDAWVALRTNFFAVENIECKVRWYGRFIDGSFNMALSQAWIAYHSHRDDDRADDEAHSNFFYISICQAFLDKPNDEGRKYHTIVNTSRRWTS